MSVGRPPVTSRQEIGRTALDLFVRRGFAETTLTDVAVAVGLGRRSLFRYFDSKNDMVWGDFEAVLERLRRELAQPLEGESPMETLGRAVVASNHYEGAELAELRLRMTLITTVPALQAHSMVRYEAWRAVVSEFIAAHTGGRPDDLIPIMVGHLALAASMSAFVRWVRYPDENLQDHLRDGYARLAVAFQDL